VVGFNDNIALDSYPSISFNNLLANRVASIQEMTSAFEWRHVLLQDNSADLISRGILPTDLVRSTIWIHGSLWLARDEDTCPNLIPTLTEIPEQQTVINLKIERSFDVLQQFSSIAVLHRVVA